MENKYVPLEDDHWIANYKKMQKEIEEIDLLTTCGTFNTKDCTTCEELCKLLKPKEEQE